MEAASRRALLLNEMDRLSDGGITCAQCPGHCCTSLANSMQTTPLETRDVLEHLKATGRWNEELRSQLRATVAKFRLDHIPGNGRRNFLRKTYDCPFFAGQNLGCTLAKEIKPYGCLGFNSGTAGETEGTSCASDQSLLRRQGEALQAVDHSLGKVWEKLPLPLALLEFEA